VRPGTVPRLLLVGVVVVVTAIAIPIPISAAWAAPNRSGVRGQVPTGQAATPPTAEQQQQQQQQQVAATAAQAAEQQAAQQQAAQQQAAQQQAAQQQAAQQQAAQQQAAQQQAALAAAQAKAAQRAAQQAARRAAKQAAQQAAAAEHASVTWARLGHPDKLVIVRATSIDSVSAGHLVQRAVRDGQAMSLRTLDAAIPSSWMTIDGDTARLNAAIVLSPTTLLDVEGVHTLQLAGGNDAAAAAFLETGSGRIRLRGVTVTSIDPATGQPVAPGAAGRPYIKVSGRGRLDATDSTISDLGTAPVGDNRGDPAIGFGRGSTGTLTRTTLARNSTGLVLAQSEGVRLQDVTADDSTANGIVLRGDRATVLSGVKADHNGADGVLVTGAVTDRPIAGIAATGNHSYGVSVAGQNKVDVSNLTLSSDTSGGLELNRLTNSRVHNITTTDEPNGVFLHLNSTNVALDALTLDGGRTAILAEKTTTGLHVTGSTITNAHVAGMQIGGHDTVLDGLTVKDSRTALRVERGAVGVTATNVSLIGGTDGLVTSGGTAGIAVNDLSADGVGDDAVRTLSPGLHITGGQIRGGTTGMDLQAATTVAGIQIGLTTTGIRARAPDPITLDKVRIDAVSVGVEAQPGSAVTLASSTVHALQAVRGTLTLLGANDLSLPPLNLLGAIGLPLIVLAIALEALHVLRQRRIGPRPRIVPPTVLAGAGTGTG
jgi:copper-binding protein NosD